jgi:hypothetical protein
MEMVWSASERRVVVSVDDSVVCAVVIGLVEAPVAEGTLREQALKGERYGEAVEGIEDERREGSEAEEASIVVVVVVWVA